MYINQHKFFLFLQTFNDLKKPVISLQTIPLKIISTDSTSMYSYTIPFWTTFPGSFFTTPSSVFVDTRNYWDSGQFVFLGIHRDPDTWRLPGVKSSRQQVTHTNSQNNIIWRIFNLFWPKTKTQFYQVICVLIPKKKTLIVTFYCERFLMFCDSDS